MAEEGRGRAGVQGRGRVRRLLPAPLYGGGSRGALLLPPSLLLLPLLLLPCLLLQRRRRLSSSDGAAAEGGGGGGSAASSCGGGGGRGEAARGDGDDGCDRRAAAARDAAGCLSFFGLGGFPSFSDSHLFCITGEKRGGDEVPRPLFCKKRGQQSREFFLNLVFRPPGDAKHNPAQHEKRGAGKALRARAAPLLFSSSATLCNAQRFNGGDLSAEGLDAGGAISRRARESRSTRRGANLARLTCSFQPPQFIKTPLLRPRRRTPSS